MCLSVPVPWAGGGTGDGAGDGAAGTVEVSVQHELTRAPPTDSLVAGAAEKLLHAAGQQAVPSQTPAAHGWPAAGDGPAGLQGAAQWTEENPELF